MGRGSFDDNNTIYAKLEARVKVKRTGKCSVEPGMYWYMCVYVVGVPRITKLRVD